MNCMNSTKQKAFVEKKMLAETALKCYQTFSLRSGVRILSPHHTKIRKYILKIRKRNPKAICFEFILLSVS